MPWSLLLAYMYYFTMLFCISVAFQEYVPLCTIIKCNGLCSWHFYGVLLYRSDGILELISLFLWHDDNVQWSQFLSYFYSVLLYIWYKILQCAPLCIIIKCNDNCSWHILQCLFCTHGISTVCSFVHNNKVQWSLFLPYLYRVLLYTWHIYSVFLCV